MISSLTKLLQLHSYFPTHFLHSLPPTLPWWLMSLLSHGWDSISVPNDCNTEQSFNPALASILPESSWRWTWTALESSVVDSFHDQPSQPAVWFIPEHWTSKERWRDRAEERSSFCSASKNNGTLEITFTTESRVLLFHIHPVQGFFRMLPLTLHLNIHFYRHMLLKDMGHIRQ